MVRVADADVPVAPSVAARLDTLASFAFQAGGIVFFNIGMDEPQPAGSAAAMFSASCHVFSTNLYNFHTISAMAQ